jgi:hypothetical protein
MPLTLIVDTTDQQQNGLYADWLTQTPVSAGEFFNADTEIDLSIQPVKPTTTGAIPWESDWVADDVYYVQIGNPDDRATGGHYALEFPGFASSGNIDYNATASQVRTGINATSQDAGYGTVTVTKLLDGVYRVDWDSNGTVPALTPDATLLEPSCEVLVKRTRNGDASTPAQQIISIRQTAVASATLTTEIIEIPMAVYNLYPPTNTRNSVWSINPGNYASGTYSIELTASNQTSVVILDLNSSIEEIGAALNTHPAINYQKTDAEDNVAITKDGDNILLTFIGTLGGAQTVRTISGVSVANPTVITTSTAHGYAVGDSVVISGTTTSANINGTQTITDVPSTTTFKIAVNVTSVTTGTGSVYNATQPSINTIQNENLVMKSGVTGTLQLNTVALAKKFFETNDDEIDFTLQVKRERAAGEQRVIFSDTITLKRELIDLETLIPLPTATDWRSGSTTCSTVDYVDVAFASAMSAADYKIVECVVKYNGAGAAPYKIAVAGVEDLTTSGFRCWFSGNATTSYSLEYTVSR